MTIQGHSEKYLDFLTMCEELENLRDHFKLELHLLKQRSLVRQASCFELAATPYEEQAFFLPQLTFP